MYLNRKDTYFQQHELVERIIPLHQKDSGWTSTTQIFVAVVGIPSDAAALRPSGIRHSGRQRKLPRHQPFRYSIHVHTEPVALLIMQRQNIMPVQLRSLPRQGHEHVLYHVHPNRPPRIQLRYAGLVQLVQVQIVYSLFCTDQNVLVSRFRVDPRGGAVDPQRTAVEYFRKAGTHVDLRCRR